MAKFSCFLSHRGKTRPGRTHWLALGYQETQTSWNRSLVPGVGLYPILHCFLMCSKFIWEVAGFSA